MLNTSQGFQNLLKEGYRHYAGLEEAILRNIEACKELSVITRTSFGPNGMKKMVVNHIDKIFVTSDASTILKEIEVNHPAAKIIAMAAKMQKDDFGDGTNYVVTFAGELLSQAEVLIKSGLHPSAVIAGYQIGLDEALKLLDTCVTLKLTNPRDENSMQKVLESSLAPKLPNHYHFFGRLLTRACISILQDKVPRFNADNIRVVKIMGGGVEDSMLVNGFVIARAPESDTFSEVRKAKIAVYGCPFDPQGGETKGTVLITKADELLKYSASEEQLAERIVKGLVEAGVNVVVVGGSIAELCQHFLNKYGLFVLKVQSKFELQRLCKSIGATALPRLETPLPEEMGFCDLIEVKEIGSTKVTLFDKNIVNSKLVTIVLRGATTTIMDNIERALENGVSAFKTVLHDDRFLPGGAAVESFLLNKLESHGSSLVGLEQYSCAKFGQAFEIFPRILLENAGMNSNEQLPNLLSKNVDGAKTGVDVFSAKFEENKGLCVYDSLVCKVSALKLAAHAALTILRVDQIIVAKPAGGPKVRDNKGWDND